MTIKGKLLTQEVREHAQVYQDRAARDAQNAEMLIQCFKASISRKVYNKVYLQKEKYTIIRRNTHEAVEDGGCFLKSIIDNYYSNTRSSTTLGTNLPDVVQNLPYVAPFFFCNKGFITTSGVSCFANIGCY
jgi:hypothetical protein